MQILKGPTKGVRSLAFSPDGNSLAAGCYDGTLRLWNLLTGEAMRLGSFGTTPKSLIWTPDGLRIIWSCGSFGFGRVCWTTIDGLTEELIGKAHDAAGVCLTPDGRTLYAATAHAICRRDIVTGIELRAWKTVSPAFLAVSPDGGTLASTHPHSPLAEVDVFHVALWDIATGTQRTRLLECNQFSDGVAFAPDGTRLAALGHESLWLWEFPACRVVTSHPSRKFYTGLAFSSDSRILATSNNDGMIRFWDSATGGAIKVFDWDMEKALCIAFSTDGTRAAAGSAKGKIVVWDLD